MEDYGCHGSGANDDTSEIVRALNDLSATPGTLHFPGRRYNCNPSIFTAINYSRLVGRGGQYGTDIQLIASPGWTCGWQFNDTQGLMLDRLSFRCGGSKAGFSGVCFTQKSGICTVRDCQFTGFPADGLDMIGSPSDPLSGMKVLDCIFLQNGGKQLRFFNSNDFWIGQNQFGILPAVGITPQFGCSLESSCAGTYAANYHWSNGVGHVSIGCSYNRYVGGNRFEMSDREGLVISGGTCNVVVGNTIHTNCGKSPGGNQSAFNGSDHLLVQGNSTFDWSGSTNASYAYAFGSGCTSLSVGPNQARDFAVAKYWFDPALGSVTPVG